MEKEIKKFKKEGKNILLTKAEKSKILTSIIGAEQEKRFLFGLPSLSYLNAVPAVLFVTIATLTYSTQASSPGDLLYDLELDVVERIEETFYRTPNAHARFASARLEERLEEFKEISDKNVLSENEKKDIARANKNIEKNVDDVFTALPNTTDVESITKLVNVSALLDAHEEILHEAGAEFETSALEVLQKEVGDKLDNETEEFSNTASPQEIINYIGAALIDINEHVSRDISLTSTSSIHQRLENAKEDLSTGDYNEALNSLLEAQIEALSDELAEVEK